LIDNRALDLGGGYGVQVYIMLDENGDGSKPVIALSTASTTFLLTGISATWRARSTTQEAPRLDISGLQLFRDYRGCGEQAGAAD
jgi:hypothetical protein